MHRRPNHSFLHTWHYNILPIRLVNLASPFIQRYTDSSSSYSRHLSSPTPSILLLPRLTALNLSTHPSTPLFTCSSSLLLWLNPVHIILTLYSSRASHARTFPTHQSHLPSSPIFPLSIIHHIAYTCHLPSQLMPPHRHLLHQLLNHITSLIISHHPQSAYTHTVLPNLVHRSVPSITCPTPLLATRHTIHIISLIYTHDTLHLHSSSQQSYVTKAQWLNLCSPLSDSYSTPP